MAGLCRRAGMSRQNYYACRRARQRREVDKAFLLERVRRERRLQPRIGCRKLLWLLGKELADHQVRVGRDCFFGIMRAAGMLVERKPVRARTTNSRHSLPVFHNLMTGAKLEGPNEAWVSDLTYIRTEEGFLYASVITDAYSRKIVGSNVGDNLEAEGCLSALEEALGTLPKDKQPIHHSDRGCQYCCHEYVERLQSRGLRISMTEVMHCYENALAERVNGILKQEYELDRTFRTKVQAKAAFRQAVWLYNNKRPHLSSGYKFPAEVHAQAA